MEEIDAILMEVIQKSIDAGDPPLATHLKAVGLLDTEFDSYLAKQLKRIFGQGTTNDADDWRALEPVMEES